MSFDSGRKRGALPAYHVNNICGGRASLCLEGTMFSIYAWLKGVRLLDILKEKIKKSAAGALFMQEIDC